MIPPSEQRSLVSSGVEESIAFGISSRDSVHIMSILRDHLYSDKVAAVVREICANAADANVAAGRADRPIEVHLPTLEDLTFRVRDCGPGLGIDEVRDVFSQYGASTKRGSDEFVGMLGIGSKSPFAYSDGFVVVSRHGGSRATYSAVIDESGAGRLDLLAVEDCDPTDTGLEVQVPVRPNDCRSFKERACSILAHFEPLPAMNAEFPVEDCCAIPGGKVYDGGSHGRWTAVMGRIPYPIDLMQLDTGADGEGLIKGVRSMSGAMSFGIGELHVAASRETLKYSEQTRRVLTARLNQAVEDYVSIMLDGIESLPGWERRLRTTAVARRGLPIPKALTGLDELYVNVDLDSKAHAPFGAQPFLIKARAWNGRMTPAEVLGVEAATRLVLKDESRPMKGYELGHRDLIVFPFPHHIDLTVVMKALKKWTLKGQLDGIPTVRLSSVTWRDPGNGSSSNVRDAKKARARLLVIDEEAVRSHKGIRAWKAVSHVPSDDDVFVVMDRYRVQGNHDFYETLRSDRNILARLGIKPPPVIGYKSSLKSPITRGACAGTEYWSWRIRGMVGLLMAHPDVAVAVEARSCISRTGVDWFLGRELVPELGDDHILTRLAADRIRCMMVIQGMDYDVMRGAEFVMSTDRPVCEGLPELALTRYPLLKFAPMGALVNNARGAWLDYVRLVDSTSPPLEKKDEDQSGIPLQHNE